jgi:hypothetical protein
MPECHSNFIYPKLGATSEELLAATFHDHPFPSQLLPHFLHIRALVMDDTPIHPSIFVAHYATGTSQRKQNFPRLPASSREAQNSAWRG